MTKKASISISINAIVTIILAMAALGVGLVVVGVLGSSTGDIEKQLGGLDENIKNDLLASDDRITMSATKVEVQRGKKDSLYFAVHNDLGQEYSFNLEDQIYCSQAIGTEDVDRVKFNTFSSITIQDGGSEVMALEVAPSSSAVTTTYRCHVELCDPDDFTGESDSFSTKCPEGSKGLYEKLTFEVIVK